LNLPVCRLRQCLEAAGARQRRNTVQQHKLAEWSVKTICSFIGAQAMVDTEKHGGRNPLIDMAADIDIFGRKSPEEIEQEKLRGPVVARSIEEDPRFQGKVAADPEKGVEADNGVGSYEAFMMLMGGPPPMPGRG